LFEKISDQLRTKSGQSQQSLFPQTVSFSAADFALVLEMQREIEALGFRFEVFGKQTVVINGIPAALSSGREKEYFEGLIEQFKINQSELAIPIQENLARALAKRACLRAGQKLQKQEMVSLIAQLFGCSNSNYTPGGNATYFILEMNKIESYFR